jgi:hypothetical protein
LEIVSHLEVAVSAGVISEMNFKLMTKEYLELVRQIELGKHLPESRTNLSGDFFSPDQREQDDLASRLDRSDRREAHSKGHDEMSFRNAYSSTNSGGIANDKRPFFGGRDEKLQSVPSRFSSDRLGFELRKATSGPQKTKYSDTRRKTIISLFKNRKDSRLSVKDVHRVIKDCSEKTVQRELVSMVSDGLLKKEGEKRWSRYRLISEV